MAEVPTRTTQRTGPRRAFSRWIADQIVDNPVFLRELRRRMRGKALFGVLMAYVAVICVVAWIIILVGTASMSSSGSINITATMRRMGDNLFRGIALIQALLVVLVGPIITADIATSERERKTLDFLQVTTLRPSAFVFGALASTMLYILLVLLLATPVLCVTFLFGGVAPSDIVASFGSLLLLSTILSAMSLWLSSLRTKGRSPQVALLFIVVLLLIGYGVVQLLTALTWAGGGAGGSALLPFSRLSPGGQMNFYGWPIPAWWVDIAMSLLLVGFFFLLGARRMFNPENRALAYWQGALIFLAIVIIPVTQLWGAALVEPETIARGGIVIWAVLTVCSLVYQTPRLEMGNEIWRLKRRFPFLRGVDESLVFMGLLLGIWWFVWNGWIAQTAAMALQPVETQSIWHHTFLFVSCAVLFQSLVCRLMSLITVDRAAAFRLSIIVFVSLWGVLPLVLGMMIAWEHGVTHPVKSTLLGFVPWAHLVQVAGDDIFGSHTYFHFRNHVMAHGPIVLAVAGAAVGLIALLIHLREKRQWPITYHMVPGEERLISEEPYINDRIYEEMRAAARSGG